MSDNQVQFWMQPGLRDWASRWNVQPVTLFAGLDPACYRTVLWNAPKFADSLIPARKYRQSQLPMLPGSFIVGICNGAPGVLPFNVMLTDLSTGRKMMNSPVEEEALRNRPFWIPDLYPITDPGLVRLEIWNQADEPNRPEVVLMVAEPRGGV